MRGEAAGRDTIALRGPIGDGPEGGLYAVALSPSGKTIAVGGYTAMSDSRVVAARVALAKPGLLAGSTPVVTVGRTRPT